MQVESEQHLSVPNEENQDKDLETEMGNVEACVFMFINKLLNRKDIDTIQEAVRPDILRELIFMMDNEGFASMRTEEIGVSSILERLEAYVKSKGLGVPLDFKTEAIESGDRSEVLNFLVDTIALIKIFNPDAYQYNQQFFDSNLNAYLSELISGTENWLKVRLTKNGAKQTLFLRNDTQANEEREEIFKLRDQLNQIKKEKTALEAEVKDREEEVEAVKGELRKQEERYKGLEKELNMRNKEYLEELDRKEELNEQMKRYELELKSFKEAAERFAIEEEKFEQMMQEKQKKISKYLQEIEDQEKTINIYELQMKEFSKIATQYKIEKEDFLRNKQTLALYQQKNDAKNKMLYYFTNKNNQTEVEKQKLDQYIKLCQQQIQKLTIENSQLRHDKLVFKNMNQNLLELGGGKGSDKVKAGSLGLSAEGKYSVKFVTILKENIKVIIILNN